MNKLFLTSALVLALSGGMSAAYAHADHGARKAAFEQTLSQLPPEKAALVKNAMEQRRADSKAKREQLRSLHKEMFALLEAPKFDKPAYLAKAKQAASIKQDMQLARAESIASVASQLTPEERRLLAETAKTHFRHGKDKPAAK